MNDLDAMMRAVIDAYEDDTPRLVYADLLDEVGGGENTDRATLIRLQCQGERLKHQETEDFKARKGTHRCEKGCEKCRLHRQVCRIIKHRPEWSEFPCPNCRGLGYVFSPINYQDRFGCRHCDSTGVVIGKSITGGLKAIKGKIHRGFLRSVVMPWSSVFDVRPLSPPASSLPHIRVLGGLVAELTPQVQTLVKTLPDTLREVVVYGKSPLAHIAFPSVMTWVRGEWSLHGNGAREFLPGEVFDKLAGGVLLPSALSPIQSDIASSIYTATPIRAYPTTRAAELDLGAAILKLAKDGFDKTPK